MNNVWEGFRVSAIFWTSNGSGFGGQIEKLKRATAIEAGKTNKTRKHCYLLPYPKHPFWCSSEHRGKMFCLRDV